MPTAMVPSGTTEDRPLDSLQLPSLRIVSPRDDSTKSHSIKEIIVERTSDSSSPRLKVFSTSAPTPRARGDRHHYFDNQSDIETESEQQNQHPNEKAMVDPPGYNENEGIAAKERSKDPETAATLHRRRKLLVEERARRIAAAHKRDSTGKSGKLDGTERTASSSQHSSWVPAREIDKDPNNKPVRTSEMEARLSQETIEIRDKAVPHKPWRPDRRLSDKRNSLAEDDDLDFSTTNEWVPSEFYHRKYHQHPQAMHISPTGVPMIMSPYPPKKRAIYQQYNQQLKEKQQQESEARQRQLQLQQLQQQQQQLLLLQQQHHQQQQQLQLQQQRYSPVKKPDKWRPQQLPQQPPSVIHTITTATTPSTPTPELYGQTSLENTITTTASPIPEHDMDERKTMEFELVRKSIMSEMSDIDWENPDNLDLRKSMASQIRKSMMSEMSDLDWRDPDKRKSMASQIRKSMASEMELSDVAMSSAESDTMAESFRDRKVNIKAKESKGRPNLLQSMKKTFMSVRDMKWSTEVSKAPTKDSEESSTIQDSLVSFKKYRKRWSSDDSPDPHQAEENSTIRDSFKKLEGKRNSDDSWNPKNDTSLKKIIDNEYSFDNNDDHGDESLLSSSLTNLDRGIPSKIVFDTISIPVTIWNRKSGASEITLDVDATRLAIESTLTSSDEDVTFGSTIHSTIHNSIISQDDPAIAAAAAAAKEIASIERQPTESSASRAKNSNNSNTNNPLVEIGPAGLNDSLLGSATTGITGKTIDLKGLTESGVSGLTTSGVLGGKDAFGNHFNLMGVTESNISGLTTSGVLGGKDAFGNINLKGLTESNISGLTTSGVLGGKDAFGNMNLKGLTESGVSGLTMSGVLEGKEALGKRMHQKRLSDEFKKKMEDIPSEVSSYIGETLSQNRNDSEADSRSSWHHRSNITVTSTMVSTKKVANKRGAKYNKRRSSTSTLQTIGDIPEEPWNHEENADDRDSSISEVDSDETSSHKQHRHNDYEEEISEDDTDESELAKQLSSIFEEKSRDLSRGGASRDFSAKNGGRKGGRRASLADVGRRMSATRGGPLIDGNLDISSSEDDNSNSSRDIESGMANRKRRGKSSSDKGSRSNRSIRTVWDKCACLDIRCFDVGPDGRRGRFNPTMGAYVVVFLVLFLVAVWTGIGIAWYRVRQPR